MTEREVEHLARIVDKMRPTECTPIALFKWQEGRHMCMVKLVPMSCLPVFIRICPPKRRHGR